MDHRIGLLVLVFLTGCSESKETRMQRFLILGNEAFKSTQYQEASRYFEEALELDSCFSDAWNNLGTVEHRQKNLKAAADFYSRAIECHPDFISAHLNRANVFYELNQLDNALSDLKRVEKIFPDTVAIPHLRGLIFWKRHRYDEALEQYRKIYSGNSREAEVLINMGIIFNALHQYDSGLIYLQRALDVNPSDARVFNAMAILEADKGNLSQANEWIEKALQQGEDAYYLNNKGYILLLLKQYDKAFELINKSIVMDPYNSWAYRNKGRYFYFTGNDDEALRLLKYAESMDPLIDKLYYWLGEVYRRKGEKVLACDYYTKALDQRQMNQAEFDGKKCK